MAVGAIALVAIAFFVKDMRDSGSRQDCLIGAQAATSGSFDQGDYADAVRGCGFDVPDDQEP